MWAHKQYKQYWLQQSQSWLVGITVLSLMWGIQANCLPQPAERKRCFVHFLSVSQCEALASVKDPMMEL